MKYRVRDEVPSEVREKLAKYHPLTQRLLYYRGISNESDAENFFNPNYERDLEDPFLLKDVEKASDRILGAINKNEKVLIYSDYDADGIPGAVILHDFFKKVGFSNFENYIPHRNDEGFGLNSDAIKEFSNKKVNLLITIDCGINGNKEVDEANVLGIETIITDHHLPSETLPKAYAIVNPNQPEDKYPFKSLCGSAVIFKLVQVLIKKGGFNIISGWDKWLLDMVALATISDMVPLIGENRTLSTYGLLVLRKTKRKGLKRLYKEAKLNQEHLTEDDISFVITPRINAASRMDEVYTAFNLLKSEDEAEAEEGAKRLTSLNNDRKILTAGIVKEIKKNLSLKGEIPKVIVAGNSKWVPSILGLVAGNLAEEFSRPVFLWGQNGYEEIKGSCRSEGVTDIFSLMHKLPSNFFNHYGGHKFSGGFGILKENIHFLEKELLKVFSEQEKNSPLEELLIDAELSIDDVNQSLSREIKRFAPYGAGNTKPSFLFSNVKIPKIEKFGKHKEHLKLLFSEDSKKTPEAIGFFVDENSFTKPLVEGESHNVLASIEESYFRNFREVRLRIIDII